MISWIICSRSWYILRLIVIISSFNRNLLSSFTKFLNDIIISRSNIIAWLRMNHWRLFLLLWYFYSFNRTFSKIMIWFIVTWARHIMFYCLLKSLTYFNCSCTFEILNFISSRTWLKFFFFANNIISTTIAKSKSRSFISDNMCISIICTGTWLF